MASRSNKTRPLLDPRSPRHFVIIDEDDGSEQTCSPEAFQSANEAMEDIDEVLSLEPGQEYRGGGGAAPAFTVRCVAGWPEPTIERPHDGLLLQWSMSGTCEATDGCTVEPDGICEHGHPAWLVREGLI